MPLSKRRRRPQGPNPAWLIRLRQALLSQPGLSPTEEHFEGTDKVSICYRTLGYEGPRLLFREECVDPLTEQVQKAKTWTEEVDAGSFVGPLPDLVFNQMVVQLATWLHCARPRPPVSLPMPSFDPYRFARKAPAGGRR